MHSIIYKYIYCCLAVTIHSRRTSAN